MDYLKIYNQLIERAKERNLDENIKYIEHHHIIPLSLNGEDNSSNIVILYPREHYIAHKLLHFAYPDNISLQYAYCMMTFTTLDKLKQYNRISTDRYYHISGRDYEYCRNIARELAKKHFKGCKYVNNGNIQRVINENDIDKYLSKGWTLGKLPFSEEALNHIRELAKSRIISDETRIKKSNSVSGDKNPCFGRKTINNGIVNKKVYKNELEEYLNNGWKLGQINLSNETKINMDNGRKKGNKKTIKDRIYVHTETPPYIIRYSKKEDVNYYLSIGYKLGRGEHIKESKENNGNHGLYMYIENPFKKEKVQLELIDFYLSKGWKFGKGTHINK